MSEAAFISDASGRPIHGGNVVEIARRHGLKPEDILDFSANINPAGPPPAVLRLMAGLQDDPGILIRYPEQNCESLAAHIGDHLGVDAECVVIANGSAALFDVIVRSLKPRRALVPIPAFSEYARSLYSGGCEFIPFRLSPDDNFQLDTDAFLAELRDCGCDFCVLSNPHNPSGSLTSSKSILNLIISAERLGISVAIDEAFIDFCPQPSHGASATKFQNVIVLRSLTKFYAMAGLRVGFAVANRDLAEVVRLQVPSWPVCGLAIAAAIEAINDRIFASQTRTACNLEREWLTAMLASMKIKVFPSAANFLLLELPAGAPSVSLNERLLAEHRIMIRDCSSYAGLESGRFARVAVKDRASNSRLINALKGSIAQ